MLWDCVSYIDDDTVSQVLERGPLAAIAISHPHFYAAMSTWSQRLDVPVYVHLADKQWVQYPGDWITFWTGDTHEILPDVTLVNCGGHFPGSSVLHWAGAADGKGVLLVGDTIKPVMDRRYVSFMNSIVNLIPMSPGRVRRIVKRLAPFDFDRIYSLWAGHTVTRDGKAALERSAERYIRHIEEVEPASTR